MGLVVGSFRPTFHWNDSGEIEVSIRKGFVTRFDINDYELSGISIDGSSIKNKSLNLQLIVKELSDKKVTITSTEQHISTKDATYKCFLDMLEVIAELATNLRKERQNEGILRAKEKGVYKGRKSSIDVDMIKELKSSGLGASAIANQMNIHRDSVYRVLKS